MSEITMNILVATWCYRSAVRKKMAAVHFTTIPFEPNTEFVPVMATLPILGLKFIKLFCAFL